MSVLKTVVLLYVCVNCDGFLSEFFECSEEQNLVFEIEILNVILINVYSSLLNIFFK